MSQRKLLFVDDEADFASVVEQQFEGKIDGSELNILFAKDGAEALKILGENKDIELVLTDINMPVMDGLEFLSQVGKLERFLKIIIVSAYSDMPNIRKAMNRGAYDFVIKPVDFSDLTETIMRAFHQIDQIKLQEAELKRLQEIEKELEMVKKIQASLLPSAVTPFFPANTFDVFGTLTSARWMGGSIYDYFPCGKNKVAIVAGETEVRGIAAAIYASSAREAIRKFTGKEEKVDRCMQQINDYLCHQKTPVIPNFALFFSIFDTETGELEYISAGMPSPFLITKNHEVIELESTKTPAGISINQSHHSKKIQLQKNDTLFIYSHGLLQLKNKENDLYCEKRFKNLLIANYALHSAALVDAVVLDARNYISPMAQINDYVIVCLKFMGN